MVTTVIEVCTECLGRRQCGVCLGAGEYETASGDYVRCRRCDGDGRCTSCTAQGRRQRVPIKQPDN